MALTTKEKKLKKLFNEAIVKVDDELSYKSLAAVVASILEDDYGTHNYKPFIKELEKDLR